MHVLRVHKDEPTCAMEAECTAVVAHACSLCDLHFQNDASYDRHACPMVMESPSPMERELFMSPVVRASTPQSTPQSVDLTMAWGEGVLAFSVDLRSGAVTVKRAPNK